MGCMGKKFGTLISEILEKSIPDYNYGQYTENISMASTKNSDKNAKE